MNVIDPTNPYKPVIVSSYSFGSTAELYAVAAAGKYAYVGVNESGRSGSGSLYVIDITNPLSPTFASKLLIPLSYITSMEIVGRYAYLADDSNGLNIVDISNPVAISLVGSVHHGLMHGRGVQVIGRYAYVSGTRDIGVDKSETGLFVIDVKNPAAPTIVDFYETGGVSGTNSGKIAELDGFLYVSNGNSGLEIFDTGTGHRSSLSIMSLDADKNEGNSGSTPFTFKVIRTGDITKAITVKWAVTVGPDPGANKIDFVGAKLPFGTVTFAAGDPNSQTITVNVQGGVLPESGALPEEFTVSLSNPTGGATVDGLHASATGFIHDDDLVPLLADLSSRVYDSNASWAFTQIRLPSIPSVSVQGPTFKGGLFTNKNATALVGAIGNDLFIAFKGTDSGDLSDINDWTHMARHYALFDPLFGSPEKPGAIDTYLGTHPGIANVYVTGHSMGASMAQKFMSDHPSLLYKAVTFASPGYQDFPTAIYDPRVTNIHVKGDIAGIASAVGGVILRKPVYKELGNQVTVIDADRDPRGNDPLDLHGIQFYNNLAHALPALGYNLPSGASNENILASFVYHPGAPLSFLPASGIIKGTIGADVIIASDGNDTLVGRAGNDTLTGRGGSDVFDFQDTIVDLGGVLLAAFGKDIITDFLPGVDKIRFSKAIFQDFGSVISHAAVNGQGDVVISRNAENWIVFEHINLSDLRSTDFQFV